MKEKRIVITGIGVLSSLGFAKEQFWQNLNDGKTGYHPITLFDTASLNVKVAGEISSFDSKEILGKKGLVDLDRATMLLLSAFKFAIEDAKIETSNINTIVTGISVGTTFGSINSISEFDRQSLEEGPHFVNPSRFPNTVINSPASRAAIRYGIKGPNATISTGFCAALDAIDYAINTITSKRASRMIVGSVEEMCIQTFLGFYHLGYLSGLKGGNPLSCPFDRRRNGIIFSEGASALILEDLDSALARKVEIYAEVLGIGSSFEPFRLHKFNPNGKGQAEAIRLALRDAELKENDIDCIFANANSTKTADLIETKAIKDVFQNPYSIPISAIKSMVGESFSASGGLSTIAAIGSITNNIIPPTINCEEHDEICDLDYVAKVSRKAKIDKVMVNSFSPNGANTVLIIGRYN